MTSIVWQFYDIMPNADPEKGMGKMQGVWQ
jgi:hypothetical protein